MNKGQSKTGSVTSSSSPAVGERVFLFLWAFLSNTRDWIMEYAHDVFNAITQNFDEKTLKEMKERKRRKKAYLQRLKHQMGYFTPERKQTKQGASPLIDQLDSISKMEDLESQLMMLKEQIAMVARAEKQQQPTLLRSSMNSESSSRRIQKKNTKSRAESAALSSNIPPPPPMSSSFLGTKTISSSSNNIPPPPPLAQTTSSNIPPPPSLAQIAMTPSKSAGVAKPIVSVTGDSNSQNEVVSASLTAKPKNAPQGPPLKHTMSIADLIKNSGSIKLRPVQKSPGGTPMRRSTSNIQGELFAAIKNKFSSVHKLQKQDCEDESDVESSSSFTCSPVKQPTTKALATTTAPMSPMVKSQAKITSSTNTNDLDKENLSPQTKFAMARRNIAKLFEK